MAPRAFTGNQLAAARGPVRSPCSSVNAHPKPTQTEQIVDRNILVVGGLGIDRQKAVRTRVRGAVVKAISPAKRGPSAARRLDDGEHTRTVVD